MTEENIRRVLNHAETGHRCLCEMERYLYTMEIACPESERHTCETTECPFYVQPTPPYRYDVRCKLNALRNMFGTHDDYLKQCERTNQNNKKGSL